MKFDEIVELIKHCQNYIILQNDGILLNVRGKEYMADILDVMPYILDVMGVISKTICYDKYDEFRRRVGLDARNYDKENISIMRMEALCCLSAMVFLWLSKLKGDKGMTFDEIVDEIKAERKLQDETFGEINKLAKHSDMLAVLAEEVGEVAKCFNDRTSRDYYACFTKDEILKNKETFNSDLHDELRQVAAVAIQWLEMM